MGIKNSNRGRRMYREPCESKPCWKCEHREYDSFFDEAYCISEIKDDGVPREIDKWGTCDCWKISELYEEKVK